MTDADRPPPHPGPVPTGLSTAALGAVVALAYWGLPRHLPMAVDAVVAVLSVALVPVVLRRPLSAGIALAGLVLLSPVATAPATFAALYAGRWRRLPVAVAVAAAGVLGHAGQGWWRPTPGLSYGWWLLLMTLAYGALIGWGALARARAELLASLRDRALRAEAEQGRRVAEARVAERTRIAREMHDVLAHRLSLVAAYAGALEYRPDAPPERLAAAAGVVREAVHQALDELREVVTLLRADDDADTDRPVPGLVDIPDLVGESRAAGVTVRLDDRVDPAGDLPAAVGRTAYRVVQEALTNARRHAPGQPVTVTLDGARGTGLVIEVRNPLAEARHSAPGSGLTGLAERVALTGGRLDHRVRDGQFLLRAELPWPRP
ncbi:sensor histidine kinase [Longispora fulva]|uniref:histidine kinase n=1 Tax=Longispora fulva TaxID=619741 RepID=A0A8J7KVS0_9ACTN|nr:histidine kinase [Longispora fulva]MBG6135632.1 signal transduction histidine kinase [Longispora fulva]